MFFFSFHRWYALIYRGKRASTPGPADLHPLPDLRVGEGVPHEPLPHPEAADRDGTPALSDRTANQNLVPEPADEAEEGDPGHQGAERAGAKCHQQLCLANGSKKLACFPLELFYFQC